MCKTVYIPLFKNTLLKNASPLNLQRVVICLLVEGLALMAVETQYPQAAGKPSVMDEVPVWELQAICVAVSEVALLYKGC